MGKKAIRRRRGQCGSCQLLRIQGIVCHETGCPVAWREYLRQCRNCGYDFKPEDRDQNFCSDSCYRDYHNLPAQD